jgi:hypothetical protein
MPGSRDDWKETFRAPSCTRDTHNRCPHLFSSGFNLLPIRPQPGAIMCRCSCHSNCPVAPASRQMRVSAKAWYTSCTCPGADLTRQRMDEAGAEVLDSDELWEKAKRDVQMRSEAFRAAQDRGEGRGREEIREIYMAELRSRGLPMPSDSALEAAVERITGDSLPSAREMGEGLIETGKLLHGIFKIFWHAAGR